MSEGISENLPPKKHGALKRIGNFIRELDPKERRKRKIRENIRVIPEPRMRILDKKEDKPNTLPTLEHNIEASKQFLESLRSPTLYSQDPFNAGYIKSNLGYSIDRQIGVEKGWFEADSVVKTAESRYQLPLAIYVDSNHAQLLVKGPYQTPEGMTVKVYNPMLSSFQERLVSVDRYGIPVGVYNNLLAGTKIARREYDLTKFLEAPDLAKYADLLTNIKAFSFQEDPYNCVPYCLFVSAMLHGLEPGATEFKRQGIKQFEQDFGVRIMTREEILPKPRVRITE